MHKDNIGEREWERECVLSHQKKKERGCTVQGGDAAYCGVFESAVAFDKRVVGFVVDGYVLVDGCAGAKFVTEVPRVRPVVTVLIDLPNPEDGVQSSRCCSSNTHHNGTVQFNQTNIPIPLSVQSTNRPSSRWVVAAVRFWDRTRWIVPERHKRNHTVRCRHVGILVHSGLYFFLSFF